MQHPKVCFEGKNTLGAHSALSLPQIFGYKSKKLPPDS